MDAEGHRSVTSPSAMLSALLNKREKLHGELRSIEKQVYDMETSYLQDSNQCGNVLKGFEGFLSSAKSSINLKRSRKFQPDDRLFSLSSITSPAFEEHMAGRDDGRPDYGPGRPKSRPTAANGQGKPRKGGRFLSREGKRIRPSSEPEFDDDDDPDVSL